MIRGSSNFLRAANFAAAIILGLLVLAFVFEVFARYFLGKPTGLVNQIAAYSMPFIAFLSAALTLRAGGHVRIGVIFDILPPRARRNLYLVTEIISLAIAIYVFYILTITVWGSYQDGLRSFSTALSFPEYIPQIIMPFGFAILVFEQCNQLILFIRASTDGKDEIITRQSRDV